MGIDIFSKLECFNVFTPRTLVHSLNFVESGVVGWIMGLSILVMMSSQYL